MTTNIQIKYKVISLKKEKTTNKSIDLRVSESNSMYIIHRALVKQMNERRSGNANSKTRSEIRGGGRKPWKQKGTGRARAGSNRSPLWRGGGVIFGPKTKTYKQKLNKKEKRLALRNLLYNKRFETIIIDQLSSICTRPSTKEFLSHITQLDIDINQKTLIVVYNKERNSYLSVRNLPNIEIIAANHININSIINTKHLLIESKALDIIEKTYNESR